MNPQQRTIRLSAVAVFTASYAQGYPLVNSINYLKVIAKQKKWTCKPWSMVNVDPEGNLVLLCYVRNE